jgi:putative component of toxin-antitoxin plasmid stabilization module
VERTALLFLPSLRAQRSNPFLIRKVGKFIGGPVRPVGEGISKMPIHYGPASKRPTAACSAAGIE